MKLSMWMIANRLTALDVELNISEDSPAELLSARQVYATNCAYVYESAGNCYCTYKKDRICIKDTGLQEGYEIIQGIFDFYNNWEDRFMEALSDGDYKKAINTAWQVFNNPLVLFNGNSQVIALTDRYPVGSMDSEWDYLMTYGNSSANAIMEILRSSDRHLTFEGGVNRYSYYSGKELPYASMSYAIYINSLLCGLLVLISKERKLNTGDFQMLKYLASKLQNVMEITDDADSGYNAKVFYYLLNGMEYDEKQLQLQLDYKNWERDGKYYVSLITLKDQELISNATYLMNLLFNLVMGRYRDCEVMKREDSLVVISSYDLRTGVSGGFIEELSRSNPVKIALTEGCDGIENIGCLMAQAEYTTALGKLRNPEKDIYCYYDYAMDYIIESAVLDNAVMGCVPAVRTMWQKMHETGDELFHTLEVFLNNECSVSKTAAELYTHRNTILYRLNKIRGMLEKDLEDEYLRNYCRISIRVLKLADTRMGR